jgi:SMC interacting uncharacterized protein involved in chromosome segregation
MPRLNQQEIMNRIAAKTNEISELQAYRNQLYAQIMRNQDLYMENYINSLKCNRKLEREKSKVEKKVQKLREEVGELNRKLNLYNM